MMTSVDQPRDESGSCRSTTLREARVVTSDEIGSAPAGDSLDLMMDQARDVVAAVHAVVVVSILMALIFGSRVVLAMEQRGITRFKATQTEGTKKGTSS